MSKHLLMLSNEPYRPGFGSTNRQRTARAAARDGWRVRYVETVGFAPVPRRPTARDGVDVVPAWNPLPWGGRPRNRLRRRVNTVATALLPRSSGRRFDAALVYDPLVGAAAAGLRATRRVYDCVDAYEYQPQYADDADRFLAEEAHFARRADVRLATSATLADHKAAAWERTVHTVVGAFEPWIPRKDALRLVAATPPSGRRALIVSALDDYKVDFPLLYRVATANPGWEFDVVGGAVFGGIGPLAARFLALDNVHHLGVADFPTLQRSGVVYGLGLMALSHSDYSRYSFPLKTWDYFCLGLPVLAFGAPGLVGISAVMHGTADPIETGPTDLDECLLGATGYSSADRVSLAYDHSADARWDRIKEVL